MIMFSINILTEKRNIDIESWLGGAVYRFDMF